MCPQVGGSQNMLLRIFQVGAAWAALGAGAAAAQVQSAPAQAAPAQGGAAQAALDQCVAQTNAKQFAAAKTSCDQALRLKPGWAEGLRGRGELAYVEGAYDAALKDLDAALDADPKYASALQLRANVYARKGQGAPALLDMETAVLLAPKNVEYLIGAADIARAMAQSDKALGYYDRALAMQPASVPALMGRGFTLRAKGDTAGALKAFDLAVRAAPNEAQPLHWRGHMYGAAEQWPKAEADFAAAVAISPRSADILSDRGDALTRMNRPADALASYEKAVAANPAYTRGVRSRAVARFRAGDLLGARLDLQTVGSQTTAAGVKDDLATIDRSLRAKYQPSLIAARSALRAADKGGVSCDSHLVSVDDYADALTGKSGDIAAAEAAVTADNLKEYRACLAGAAKAGAGATADLPALRIKVAELIQAQTRDTAALQASCAASPPSQAICATLSKEIADESVQLRADQRRLETALMATGTDVARLDSDAPLRIQASLTKARAEFTSRAARAYAEEIDFDDINKAVSRVRSGSVAGIYQACGSIRLQSPNSDAALDRANSDLRQYRSCLDSLSSKASSASSEYYRAHAVLRDAVAASAKYRAFRCSARPGPGCVDDALWTRANSLATPALRDQALAYSKAAGDVPDQVDVELTRINDAVGRINAEVKRQNNWANVGNALGAFADAFNAASPQYRPSTSTVAPGMR